MARPKEDDRNRLSRGVGGRPQFRKTRRRFTAARQEKFFATLAATCNVTRACRAAGISAHCAYDHRNSVAAFRARWAAEVREAYARLELMMIERMMNGSVKTVTRTDGSVETIHQYSDAVALQLLRLHRQTAAEAAIDYEPEEADEARARIADKLDRLEARLEREAADKAADGGGGSGGKEGEGGEEGDSRK